MDEADIKGEQNERTRGWSVQKRRNRYKSWGARFNVMGIRDNLSKSGFAA